MLWNPQKNATKNAYSQLHPYEDAPNVKNDMHTKGGTWDSSVSVSL